MILIIELIVIRVILHLKTLYESWEKVIDLFDNYSGFVSEAKYKGK